MADNDPVLRRVLARDVALTRGFWLIVHAELRKLARVAVAAEFIADQVRSARARFLPAHE